MWKIKIILLHPGMGENVMCLIDTIKSKKIPIVLYYV